jgi:hypothetical protein
MAEFNIKDYASEEGVRFLWDNNGKFGPGENDKVTIQDALSVPNAPLLFPKVISNIVREAVEPLLVATSLLQRINYSYGQTITFPAVGAITAADIAEGQEYPERTLQMGGAPVTATIGKSGVAVKVTDEMIRYSQFDVIGLHLRAAGRALARHKEVKVFNYIRTMGVTVFDNVEPTKSAFGVTTGRSLDGSANGSVTMDDVFDAFAQIVTQGYMPNTLLMHPLTWTMFVKDPQLRAFVQANGGGTFFATWTGNPAGLAPWGAASQGGLGVASGQMPVPGQTATGGTAPHSLSPTPLLQYPQFITSAPVLPNYMNIPFRIIVSPFVPFDPRRKLTDIYMFDSNELGVLVVDEDLTTEEFDDPKVDIRKIKLRERYAIGILNEGQAIATLRNVHVVPNEIVLPAETKIDISSNFQRIAPNTALNL